MIAELSVATAEAEQAAVWSLGRGPLSDQFRWQLEMEIAAFQGTPGVASANQAADYNPGVPGRSVRVVSERSGGNKAKFAEWLNTARQLDEQDRLRHFRSQFHFPVQADGTPKVYFCGNSLGLQHESVPAAVEEVLASWRERAVAGHFSGTRPWMRYHEALREGQAEMLGAKPGEIVTMNTLTANLHLAMASFYRPSGKRCKVVIEQQAFPSDRYAVASQIRWHGLDPAECLVELAPAEGERLIDEDTIERWLHEHGDTVALVLWPGLQYATGQVFDLQRIAAAARSAGAAVGFDLAHSAGNVPVALNDSECDFAAWCTYKYLNAGPGAVGGMYVHPRHYERTDLPRLQGWFGNELATRFLMKHDFAAASGADAWTLSTPPTLLMAPLRASLEVFREAGWQKLCAKSRALTAFFAQIIERELGDDLEIITPSDLARRGCQLSLRVKAGRAEGRALFEHLEAQGIVPDWREPDVIRVAPVPLYNSFEDGVALVRAVLDWKSQAA